MADMIRKLPTRVNDTRTTQERNDLNRVSPAQPSQPERTTRTTEIARNDQAADISATNDAVNHQR
jgi:hypothetical protein